MCKTRLRMFCTPMDSISHTMQLILQLGFNVWVLIFFFCKFWFCWFFVFRFLFDVFSKKKEKGKQKSLPLKKPHEVHVMWSFNWKLKKVLGDLPLLVPVWRAAGPSGIKARIKPSSLGMTRQQGIMPPKAKPAPRQLSANHHKEHFRLRELRAQHRHCSHVEAGNRREGMQCLHSSSRAADLLRKCMLQIKSVLETPSSRQWTSQQHLGERQIRIPNPAKGWNTLSHLQILWRQWADEERWSSFLPLACIPQSCSSPGAPDHEHAATGTRAIPFLTVKQMC